MAVYHQQLTVFPVNPDLPKINSFLGNVVQWLNFTAVAILLSMILPWFMSVLAFLAITAIWPKETYHRVFNVGLIVVAYWVLPNWLFFGLMPIVGLVIEDKWYFDGYAETYRAIEMYLTRVAIANAEAGLIQLRMDLTPIAVADFYCDLLKTDQEPSYYRKYRDSVRAVYATVLHQLREMPQEKRRGHDYAVMQQLQEMTIDEMIARDANDRRVRRERNALAACVEYA